MPTVKQLVNGNLKFEPKWSLKTTIHVALSYSVSHLVSLPQFTNSLREAEANCAPETYSFISQCHPNKFNKNKLKKEVPAGPAWLSG